MASYKELLAQRAMLEREIEEARQTELSDAIGRAKQLIAEHGLTAADLGFKVAGGFAGMTAGKIRTPVAVKYRGPNGETWSGRGKAPNWLTSLVGQGRNRDDFLVSP
ncbi:MAG: H-NS histone family protein [Candidatus Accumulibacter sp.]|jgi:DNA-binding protein H-NS|uniref:H-NS histone family protein n=1 Tax=Candidatus Accumulibacter affinis TaxID=2954384 RepID=A0A935T9J7_9PROT|nr:H-NS histone family protein [Candidatus Accumulibacter affinis]